MFKMSFVNRSTKYGDKGGFDFEMFGILNVLIILVRLPQV